MLLNRNTANSHESSLPVYDFNRPEYQPIALTANEAQYLVGFRTPDEIRNRLATARKEINHRLRSKGIRWADERKDAGDAW